MTLALPPHLRAIVDMEYPRFSDAEMRRRRSALEGVMAAKEVAHVLLTGQNWGGSGVLWLTGWPVTTEAIVVVTPGARDAMYVQYHNHVPQATRVARDATVGWGQQSTVATAVAELDRRGCSGRRVGVIGPLSHALFEAVAAKGATVVDLNRDYVGLRLVKSAEEVDWMRIGAAMSDAGIAALRDGLRPGLTERELGGLVAGAYTKLGGRTVIHFFGVTSMAEPNLQVPCQWPSSRTVKAGDVVFTEISAAFWDHSGQVLRTFTVGADPTPLYRDLHDAATAAFDAVVKVLRPGATMPEIVEAASVIEAAGFTVCDDLVHGYGGGYFPPILGTKSRPAGPLPDLVLREGMMMVVQPNVITPDGKAGVQTGELVRITATGAESMHAFPKGLHRVG
ncbi:MAG: M24 family metallopeptidase [Rhodospirillales bacterium]